MKITRKLTLLALLPLLLLLGIGAVAVTTFRAMHDVREMNRIAGILETRVFALDLLAYDYLREPGERARVQWEQNHEALGEALAEARRMSVAPQAVRRLSTDHIDLAAAFDRLTAHHAHKNESVAGLWAERESWLVARLLLLTQIAFADAVKVGESAEQRMGRELAFFLAVTLALLALVGTAVAILAWRIGAGIRISLQRLHLAAEVIAAGNLDYRAAAPAQDEHGELAQAINTMARNLKSFQQQLIQSEKLSALGTLAAGVAHELNNPLMGVMGYVGLAQHSVQEPRVREMLAKAQHELERMRDLLKNMLGFARPIDEARSLVNLHAVLERATSLIHPALRAQGIRLHTELPDDLPAVLAKEGHLQQVFVNLLMNALDALNGCTDKRIDVEAYCRDGQVCIEVKDSGAGIPAEVRERIFDPFFTTKPPGQGTGLGLSIARNIMNDLGGSLTYDPSPKGPTTFRVILPLSRGSNRETREEKGRCEPTSGAERPNPSS